MVYENIEKKPFISQETYLYIRVTDIFKFYEVLFCTYCKGLLCLLKIVAMLIFFCICIKNTSKIRKWESTIANWILGKIVWRVDFLVGNWKSQNVLFHLPDWASAEKLRLYHWTVDWSIVTRNRQSGSMGQSGRSTHLCWEPS